MMVARPEPVPHIDYDKEQDVLVTGLGRRRYRGPGTLSSKDKTCPMSRMHIAAADPASSGQHYRWLG